jgi:hypothetical protein
MIISTFIATSIEPIQIPDPLLPEEEQFLLLDDETDFWLQSSQTSLDTIWDNAEDEVYTQLLLNS